MSTKHVVHGVMVWFGKPWIVPALIVRSVVVFVVAVLFLWLEIAYGVASVRLGGSEAFAWTLFTFAVIWLLSMVHLLVLWATNSYVLRQDGLEVRRGLIRLHSFVVTPLGFGDLEVYQSLGGRIFGYGTLTVNSQGERETKLFLVRSPFTVADTIRDIMGKPIVRVEDHV